MAAVLDTHAAIWYLFRSSHLSSTALWFIRNAVDNGQPVYISAISMIEVIYLVERGRVPADAYKRLHDVLTDPTSGVVVVPLDVATAEAVRKVDRSTVPDMPDRIIAATALSLSLPLVTRDRRIQSAGIQTIW
jgi:PIN domain nuclease of toxin-antitoxin system